MKARLVGLVLAISGCVSPSQIGVASQRAAEVPPRPVVVLLRHSVWFRSLDRPLFVLYDDGTAIFPKTWDGWVPKAYQSSKINLKDRTDALASLGIGAAILGLNPRYDFAPNVTDQETIILLVWRGDSLTRVDVRAGMRQEGKFIDNVPAAFQTAYERLTLFEGDSAAAPWEPTELQVFAWPYEYAPDDPPLPWPSNWPNLTSPESKCRSDAVVEELCTMRLGASHQSELEDLLASRREKQAISISGRKVAVGYRVVFPGEDLWRSALSGPET